MRRPLLRRNDGGWKEEIEFEGHTRRALDSKLDDEENILRDEALKEELKTIDLSPKQIEKVPSSSWNLKSTDSTRETQWLK